MIKLYLLEPVFFIILGKGLSLQNKPTSRFILQIILIEYNELKSE